MSTVVRRAYLTQYTKNLMPWRNGWALREFESIKSSSRSPLDSFYNTLDSHSILQKHNMQCGCPVPAFFRNRKSTFEWALLCCSENLLMWSASRERNDIYQQPMLELAVWLCYFPNCAKIRDDTHLWLSWGSVRVYILPSPPVSIVSSTHSQTLILQKHPLNTIMLCVSAVSK